MCVQGLNDKMRKEIKSNPIFNLSIKIILKKVQIIKIIQTY